METKETKETLVLLEYPENKVLQDQLELPDLKEQGVNLVSEEKVV